jgi:excinuclease ABC subunit A
MRTPDKISLRGVRVHNLKSIDVDIPLGKLTVVTGVSGAGKRSLVFDTLYAEAQRRYLQSFSAYTRQFLERFDKPDAEEIGALPPAVAIRQAHTRASPRLNVAALAEIDEPIRVLFARHGTLICPSCGQTVIAFRTPDVVTALQALQALPAGTRAAIAFPAVAPETNDWAAWSASLLEEGYVRIKAGQTVHRLDETPPPTNPPGELLWVLIDRVEIGRTTAERMAESVDAAFRRGAGRIGVLTDTIETIYDQRFVCARCHRTFPAPEPRLFDYKDPLGACPQCEGHGVVGKAAERCPLCDGRRWNTDALAVQIGGRSVADWHALPLTELTSLVTALPTEPLRDQVTTRLDALVALDLGYLTPGQSASSVPDGAARRIALANALAAQLVHMLYLIDEPTVGLHPTHTTRLVATLHQLRDRGNTLVVIDHDREILTAADHLIDLGPGAGEEGGAVVYQGAVSGLANAAENPTSNYWTQRTGIEIPTSRRKPTDWLKLSGASTNNLQNLSVDFPLGVLCVVTGVSGAGKRSLVEQTLFPALTGAKKKKAAMATTAKVAGAQRITEVVLLEQESLARRSRSNPATFLKIFDAIRELFAETVEAKIRNFGPGHFSFNQPGGRCETCEGQGTMTIDMQFLADVMTVCPECHGQRYRKDVLDIKVRSLSIAQVLDLTIREAFRFFRAQPAIEKKLKVLLDVGLEYLRLGQASDTWSASEGQRLKLAGHLASSRKTGGLFLIIEPTAGLHPDDVATLLECFDRLLSAGHSLIVIEHNLDVIRSADWLIDLGPEGGKQGGHIVAEGTPEDVARVANSRTGSLIPLEAQASS